MQEGKHHFERINKLSPSGLLRLFLIFGISLLFIQFLSITAFARTEEYYEGYTKIINDDGSNEIINGDLNFLRWDGFWRPNEELNISNGSWPYKISENATTATADFTVDDTTLSIPRMNTEFTMKPYSISYNIKIPIEQLQGKGVSLNPNTNIKFPIEQMQGKGVSFNSNRKSFRIPHNLKSRIPKTKYKDRKNIRYGRLHFKAGMEDIVIHDDTFRDYIEGGEVVQDVTYLLPGDYNYGVDNNGEIQLEFNNDSLNKLKGNVIIEIKTWDIVGPNNWGGKVTFSYNSYVRATGNVEIAQKVPDYVLYTRFDEGKGIVIHNENILNRPLGELKGSVVSGTWTTGKYGKAIHFDGVKNKVLFSDHPDFRLPGDFTISYYIRLTSDVNNIDSDITRKGSTANSNAWWKVEIKNNKMQGVVYKGESSEVAEKDTVDRRDGNWHFVAYTRGGHTCTLMVDGVVKASRSNCATNAVNSAQLAIGAKDTETSGTGKDYTHGTIDEVRFFKRKLSSTELNYIRYNAHVFSGKIIRDLRSVIISTEEIKSLGCSGTWDQSITKVDVQASTDNINWRVIKSNSAPGVMYPVNPGSNYKYSKCFLSTTDRSKTPVVTQIRAFMGPK